MSPLLSVEDARARILQHVAPLGPERVPLEHCVDRVLATAVVAGRALPAFDDSAMDGYAVRAAEVAPGVRLPVAFAVAAGQAGDQALPVGTAARIFTGAPLPPGADAVVIQEDTAADGEYVVLQVHVSQGENVRRAGHDVGLGTPVLAAGRVLSPGDVALLAALGHPQIEVGRVPTVAILSSGNELVEAGGPPPARGQVVASVGVALAAAVRALGGRPRLLPVVADEPVATRAAVASAASADVLLTIGGMSVGAHDHMAHTLRALCGDGLAFHKVAIKPGKPLAFGMLGACRVFGLPGNPVSALVAFEVFVRPALLGLMGHTRVLRRPVPALLTHPLPAGGSRAEYRRATVGWSAGRRTVDARRNPSSGALSSLAGADALLPIAVGAAAKAAGDEVEVLLLGPDLAVDRLILSGG